MEFIFLGLCVVIIIWAIGVFLAINRLLKSMIRLHKLVMARLESIERRITD